MDVYKGKLEGQTAGITSAPAMPSVKYHACLIYKVASPGCDTGGRVKIPSRRGHPRGMNDAGQRDFGESRAQELAVKAPAMPEDVRWHFIGHLPDQQGTPR